VQCLEGEEEEKERERERKRGGKTNFDSLVFQRSRLEEALSLSATRRGLID
jgi:hypothetical protein